jgi:hypothetical protein
VSTHAQNMVYELLNVADHVAGCAKGAQRVLECDPPDIKHAFEQLEWCKRSADQFEMRYRDAVAALSQALAETLLEQARDVLDRADDEGSIR